VTAPESPVPGYAVVDLASLDRMAYSAAEGALKRFREEESIQDEMKKVAEEVLDRFMERAFDVPPGDVKALIELRKDFGFMRFAREMRDSAIRQGLIVLVGAFVVGLISAVVYKFSGGKIG
jgi:hypothetical protein